MSARPKSSSLTRVDLLSALEVHIPSMRALYHKLSPLIVAVSNWDRDDVVVFDKSLANSKASRTVIDEALRKFTHAGLRNIDIEQIDFPTAEIDFHLCLALVQELAKIAQLAEAVTHSYSMPYQVLCSRIGGRGSFASEGDDLHNHYGVFNQSKIRFIQELSKAQEFATRLMDYSPHATDLVDSIIEVGMRATDLVQSLQQLNSSHHRGIEYAFRPTAYSHG